MDSPSARSRVLSRVLTCLAVVLFGCTAACSTSPTDSSRASGSPTAQGGASGSPTGTDTRGARPVVTGTIASGLNVPWGLTFLPGGDALVSERDSGRILRIGTNGTVHQVGTLPGVVPGGEGGQLDLAVSPHFATDHLLYAYYTSASDNRIVRMTYRHGKLGTTHPILTGIPKGQIHNGGRIVFGPDGLLYASTGNTGDGALSQDKHSLGGKILRVKPDGGVPRGNPFHDSPVYSYGHRNVEGLAFASRGRLWATEFGANTWDELNLIRPGGNYGWPTVEGKGGGSRFIDPVWQWHTDQASPSGIAIVDDVIYVACLRGERVWRAPITGDHVERPQALFTGEYGRLRTIAKAPDGSLWLTTSNRDGRGTPHQGDDKILRVRP